MSEDASITDVLHAVELLRRDVSHLEQIVRGQVNDERYTIEMANVKERISTLERSKELMRNAVISALLFPIVVAFVTYLITTSGGS